MGSGGVWACKSGEGVQEEERKWLGEMRRAMALDAGVLHCIALHGIGGCFVGQYLHMRLCVDEQL